MILLLCREMAGRGEVWLELILASETVAVTSRGPATSLASLLAQLSGGLGLVCLLVALLVTRGQGGELILNEINMASNKPCS